MRPRTDHFWTLLWSYVSVLRMELGGVLLSRGQDAWTFEYLEGKVSTWALWLLGSVGHYSKTLVPVLCQPEMILTIIPSQGNIGSALFTLWFTCLCLTHLTLTYRPMTPPLSTLITFWSLLCLFLRWSSTWQLQCWYWSSPNFSSDVEIEVPLQCTWPRSNHISCSYFRTTLRHRALNFMSPLFLFSPPHARTANYLFLFAVNFQNFICLTSDEMFAFGPCCEKRYIFLKPYWKSPWKIKISYGDKTLIFSLARE